MMRIEYGFFFKYEEGVVREILSKYPYLLITMEIWTGYWKNNLERMNMKVDEDKGEYVGMVK